MIVLNHFEKNELKIFNWIHNYITLDNKIRSVLTFTDDENRTDIFKIPPLILIETKIESRNHVLGSLVVSDIMQLWLIHNCQIKETYAKNGCLSKK